MKRTNEDFEVFELTQESPAMQNLKVEVELSKRKIRKTAFIVIFCFLAILTAIALLLI
jgi:hypothetical protein